MKGRSAGGTARGAALNVLCRVDRDASYSVTALDSELSRTELSREDRGLATRLVYGTLQKRIFLDYQIERSSGRRTDKMDIPVLNAVRLGAYQIFFCDRIPISAAVNESVNLVKKSGFTSAAGFVNAVLRKLDREKAFYPPDEQDAMAVKYSVPPWMVEHFRRNYPQYPAEDILKGLDSSPPAVIRVNTLLTNASELERIFAEYGISAGRIQSPAGMPADGGNTGDAKPAVPDAYVYPPAAYLTDGGAMEVSRGEFAVKGSKAFADGLFHVQDLSSQLCAAALRPERGDRILDICSAPGGKAFTAAELAGGECDIVAADIYPQRVRMIEEGAKRLRLGCIRAVTRDALAFHEELGAFDRVICDVPCSGLGVMRRKPEIRFKPQSELAKYPATQLQILSNAARYLRPGGRLVYSTCTLNPEENQRVTEAFSETRDDFEKAELWQDGETEKTFFPHIDKTDGFFIAAFEKRR